MILIILQKSVIDMTATSTRPLYCGPCSLFIIVYFVLCVYDILMYKSRQTNNRLLFFSLVKMCFLSSSILIILILSRILIRYISNPPRHYIILYTRLQSIMPIFYNLLTFFFSLFIMDIYPIFKLAAVVVVDELLSLRFLMQQRKPIIIID